MPDNLKHNNDAPAHALSYTLDGEKLATYIDPFIVAMHNRLRKILPETDSVEFYREAFVSLEKKLTDVLLVHAESAGAPSMRGKSVTTVQYVHVQTVEEIFALRTKVFACIASAFQETGKDAVSLPEILRVHVYAEWKNIRRDIHGLMCSTQERDRNLLAVEDCSKPKKASKNTTSTSVSSPVRSRVAVAYAHLPRYTFAQSLFKALLSRMKCDDTFVQKMQQTVQKIPNQMAQLSKKMNVANRYRQHRKFSEDAKRDIVAAYLFLQAAQECLPPEYWTNKKAGFTARGLLQELQIQLGDIDRWLPNISTEDWQASDVLKSVEIESVLQKSE